ncbi:MAG: hypothetical protein ACLPYM_02060 [Limisphaerales bacterium]
MKDHFKRVLEHVHCTDHKYRSLYCNGIPTKPIPFFGSPESALVVTIGLNPSNAEFAPHRGWPDSIADLALETRLRDYFSPNSRPHPFFNAWTETFKHLSPCVSYAAGSVAHLDLSPRATDFPSKHQRDNDWLDQFLGLVVEDVRFFFDALKKCKKAKLVMAAGTATKRFYLDHFIRKNVPSGVRLNFERRGAGRNTLFHKLTGSDFDLPVFFSGAGPAYHGGTLLIENVRLNRDALNRYLQ